MAGRHCFQSKFLKSNQADVEKSGKCMNWLNLNIIVKLEWDW
jgi:hypothetical protein